MQCKHVRLVRVVDELRLEVADHAGCVIGKVEHMTPNIVVFADHAVIVFSSIIYTPALERIQVLERVQV